MLLKYLRNEKGSTIVITMIVITSILGSTALVIDIGSSFIAKSRISNAADAAVLAGAVELPTNPEKAIDIATDYLYKNGVSQDEVNINILENNTVFEVNVNRNVKHSFAKAIGINNSNINTKAVALIAPAVAIYDGFRPFVVEDQPLSYGQSVALKVGGGDGTTGNYGAVALGGTGADVFRDNIMYGYKGKIDIGNDVTLIDTETGNMSGATKQGVDYIESIDSSTWTNFNRDSHRLWVIPVVDSLQVAGRKEVRVVGFAQFFMEGLTVSGGKASVTGRFIEFVTNADIDPEQPDYGLRGVKLIY